MIDDLRRRRTKQSFERAVAARAKDDRVRILLDRCPAYAVPGRANVGVNPVQEVTRHTTTLPDEIFIRLVDKEFR